ncbi:TPA: hypothetical protein ACWV7G_001566 [Salmonella enterica subsp. enterica serovar Muenchen]|nr:hypothetical protein [Salmonella enterica subsp. enterica serovar Muenchen]ECG0447471.1 hypothetical protein [Salmonella enterica]ECJ4484580.1 hypothetical protein [Salmonella enterica subsp. diarizonae]EBY3556182.1 hypothetical protein [Salmonella enterica subsp. enterica serovar Muenchen]ECZ0254961.1 hypothetical protein [Salmonella enterica subsp. diarizonae]
MNAAALLTNPLPAVVIGDDVWQQMVRYSPAPVCETERLQRLVYHAAKALAQARKCDSVVTFGYFCLPPDGSPDTPLWRDLQVTREPDRITVSMAR